MSADRELLELAARAAGIEFTWGLKQIQVGEPDTWGVRQYREEPCPMTAGLFWNPLTDDGDCFRLMMRAKAFDLPLMVGELALRHSLPLPDDDEEARRAFVRRAIVEHVAGHATTQTESEKP